MKDNKELQLGEPVGKATHRLKKIIMFNLLQKLNEDNCFVCLEKILKVNELSIEHKIPWLHSDFPKDLFWSLDNIAFSHLKCNKPRTHQSKNKRTIPDGYGWCYKCKKFLLKEFFHKNKSRIDGLSSDCKDCSKIRDCRKNHGKLVVQ